MLPEEVLLNVTVSGNVPDTGLPVNCASGAAAETVT